MEQLDERRAAAIDRITSRRDFKAHVAVYCIVNALLVVIWAASGAGYFWPIWSIAGWGVGLAAHAWQTFGERPVTDAEIAEELRRSP